MRLGLGLRLFMVLVLAHYTRGHCSQICSL